ncbi:MAG: carbon storage regulator [Pirellulaceae bacterium]
MLVLTRRAGEKIVISGNICIHIVNVCGERVRIGISAPSSVRIDREEVHQRRVQEANQAMPAVLTLPEVVLSEPRADVGSP